MFLTCVGVRMGSDREVLVSREFAITPDGILLTKFGWIVRSDINKIDSFSYFKIPYLTTSDSGNWIHLFSSVLIVPKSDTRILSQQRKQVKF